ncbi:MAG: Serralysin C, partial [Alphaproteobacteria bacterium MarineAlpha10_Bin2]
MAETWDLTSTQANLNSLSASSSPSLVIADHATITDTITISSGLRIDHIEVDLDLSHTWIGDLVVSLTSPDDTTSVLVNRPGVNPFSIWGTGQDDIDFTLSSTHSWGEAGAGTWTLSVTDFETGDQGILNNWTLRLLGDAINNDDTYIYTDEFGAFTGAGDAARRVLSDSDGTDTLNAAAVSADSTIDLNPGANGTIAGNSLTIASETVIENAYAGDGNDQLTGNSFDNSLHGGRGDDILSGGGGNDYLLGGSGDDVLSGGTGNDYFDAGSGANRFLIGAGEADDTIWVENNSLSIDVLQFGGGIGLSDVGFSQSNNDLTITLSEAHGGGAVTVSGFFAAGGGQRIDTIEFDADATTLNVSNYSQLSDFLQPALNQSPTVIDQGFVVAENTALGTVVGTVSASDPDAGDVLSYAITAGNESGAFSIDAGTGQMTVEGALDFEELNSYTLTVQVTDGGLLSDSAAVSIDLTDVNEAPTLGDQGFAVAENVALGTVVGTVASSDPDAGDALSYAIASGSEGGAFAIDAGTGEITVQGALDYEGQSSYALTVEVTDGGLLSDSAVVSIDLTDINETPTVGDQGFSIDENTVVGTVVGVVTASDPDAGDALSYAISAGNEGGAFAIDAGTGEITVQGALDFEGLNTFALTVSVTDGGLLSDSAVVNIDLADINEVPRVGDQGFSIDENTAAGTVVGTVAASDPDAGDALSYAIASGNEGGTFAIDAGSGEITVQGALDFEGLNSYALTVQVTDGGLLSDSAAVSIDLTDINEAPTVGDQGFAVDENAALGTVVGTVGAGYPDAGDALSYAISVGNEGDAFAIDAITG